MTNINEAERKSVAEVVWQWKAGGTAQPPASHLLATLLQTAVACAVATFLVFYKKHYVVGGILYTLGALMLLGGLFVPPLHAAFTRFGKWLGHVVGVGATWLLLVPFYYLFFTTAHVFLLLRGKDPLTRRWDPAAASYWADRKPAADDKHFLRQS